MTSLTAPITLPITERQKGIFNKDLPQLPVTFSWQIRTATVPDMKLTEENLKALFHSQEALFIRFIPQPNMVFPLQQIDPLDGKHFCILLKEQVRDSVSFFRNCKEHLQHLNEYCVFAASRHPDHECFNAYLQVPFGIADFHSIAKLCTSITQIFSGTPVSAPVISYSQYASWQTETLKSTPDDIQSWFRQQLSLRSMVTPFLFENSSNTYTYEKACLNKTTKLYAIAESVGVTVKDCCYAIFSILLSHFTGKDAVLPAVLLNGRVYDELNDTVGLIDQMIPLPVTMETSFKTLVHQISQQQAERQSVAEYFSNEFIQEMSGNKLPYAVQYISMPAGIDNYSDWQLIHPGVSLQLDILDTGKELITRWSYNTTHFDKPAIEQIDNVLQRLLTAQTTDVNELTNNFYPPEQNNTTHPDFITLFKATCKKYPEAIAIQDNDLTYTYKTLEQLSSQLSAVLIKEKGIRPGDIVAINAPRTANLIITIIAILKAGAAFLPIDRSQPPVRIQSILEDASPALTLYGPDIAALLDAPENTTAYPLINREDLAYVIYTSGTTGKPKGCMVTGNNLAHYIHWCRKTYTLDQSCGNFPWFTPLSFDLTITSIFLPLTTGKKIVIFREDEPTDSILKDCFSGKKGIDCIKLTPSHINLLKTLDLSATSIQVVITGGEQLLPAQTALLFNLNKDLLIFNEYGPTEATVGCIVKNIKQDEQLITIGYPIDGMEACILNNDFKPLLPGLAGELFLTGAGITRGYLHNKTLTNEKFIAHNNQVFYKTGDLVRQLPNGELVFLGRIDQQVKIRGYRIETEEIIHHLKDIKSHVLVEYHGDDPELAVFFEGNADVAGLLKQALPAYMVPQHYYRISEIPLTVNGKVDAKKLLSHSLTIKDEDKIYEPPVNDTEEKIAAIWKEILHKEQVSRHDHFFTSGGQSIKASALVARLNKHFQTGFTLKDIFEYPLLSQQAIQVSKTNNTLTAPVLLPPQEQYELSGQQLRIWTEHNATRFSTAYNMPAAYQIQGDFSIERFVAAFERLIAKFESLRTTFVSGTDGIPKQLIHTDTTLCYQYEELTTDIETACKQHAQLHIPLDIRPLYRVALYKLSDKWLLLINLHHIIADGLSEEILFDQLLKEYTQLSDHKTDNSFQYKEYAVWQNNQHHTGSRSYWLNKFKDPIPATAGHTQNNLAASCTVSLGSQLSDKLHTFAAKNKSTIFPLLLSLTDVLLYRYSGEKTRVIAVPVDNRLHEAFMQQVGFFLNTILLKNELNPASSFSRLTANWNTHLTEGLQHKQYPYESLAKELMALHGAQDLFHILVNYQERQQGNSIETAELRLEKLEYNYQTHAKAGLAFNFSQHKGTLELTIDYNLDLYTEGFITQMMRHCLHLADQLITQPDKPVNGLKMLSGTEIAQWLHWGTGTPVNVPEGDTIISRFLDIATLYGDHIAIVHQDKGTTYDTLARQVATMSTSLRKCGVIPGQILPVLAARNEATITAMLAVMHCGAVYLPIDATSPEERIKLIIAQCEAKLILNTSGQSFNLDGIKIPGKDASVSVPADINGASPAYMIFTSGSTGTPKGLTISHTGLLNTISAQINGFGIQRTDNCCWFSSPAFDASLSEIFLALLSGAAVYTADPALVNNQYLFISWLTENNISVATIPPAYLSALSAPLPQTLRVLISAGETLPERTGMALAARHMLFNAYGPSENAICTTFTRIQPGDDKMPLGMPISNVKVRVLDGDGQLLPAGITGELHISGIGLTKEYHKKETDSFYTEDNEHWYRTGDFVRWLDDGRLVFAGRKDEQIKINGNRVELEDIRHSITKHSLVKDALVIYNQHLIAYIVPENTGCNAEILTHYTKSVLPGYMVPAFFILVPEIPVTSNGKRDASTLPLPVIQSEETLPMSSAEKTIADIYTQLLKTTANRNTNFFAAGGDSLRAIQLISAIYKQSEKAVSLGDLYKYPAVKELALLLNTIQEKETPQPDSEWINATPMQQKIWADMEVTGAEKYQMTGSFELTGQLNEALFRQAITSVLAEQEMLRARFRISAEGLQYSIQDTNTLCSFELTKQQEDLHIFSFALHHLIADAWSIKVIITSIAAYYAGNNTKKDITKYSHYAQNIIPAKTNKSALINTSLLKEKHTKTDTGYFRQAFNKHSTESISKLAAIYKISPFALITGLQALAFMDHQQELTVFAPLHGRFETRWYNTVGLCMNVVPFSISKQLYTNISDLLEHVQYQYTTFLNNKAQYMAPWVPEETTERGILEIHIDDFDEHYRQELPSLPGITIRPLDNNISRKFSMEIHFKSDKPGLSAECLYDQQSYSTRFVQRGTGRFEQLLSALHDQPLQTITTLENKLHNSEKETMQSAQSDSIRAFLKKN